MADNVNTAEPEVNIILNVNSLARTTSTGDLVKNNNGYCGGGGIRRNRNVKQHEQEEQQPCKTDDAKSNHVTFCNKNDGSTTPSVGCSGSRHHHHHHDATGRDSYASYTSTTDSSDESSESSSDLLDRAPDGGWGWVVVFASFMVNMIADGVTFSFGVIFIEFEKYFDEGKSKTAWIGSLFMAVPLLSGPVASFMTDRYGCQRVTIIGSVIASAGFVMSAFADSLFVLFITFGLISGFGLSLCYVAAVVIVAYYFDKRRSLATGLSVCGSGIGTFVFAPLNHELLSYYGWRGCTLILAGLFLNLCVFGMLMRDLPWTKEKAQNERKKKKHARLLKRRLKSTASYDRHSQHTQLQSSPTSGTSKDEIEQLFQDELGESGFFFSFLFW